MLRSLWHSIFPQPQSDVITPRAHGIDISKYDVRFEPQTATGQLDFVIQRVSYNLMRDDAFETLLPGVLQIPVRGAYHYLRSSTDWRAQADVYLSIIRGCDYHFSVCDFEGAYNTLSTAFARNAWQWIDYVEQKTGRPCIIYTSPSLYKSYILPTGLDWNRIKYWQAQYPPSPDPNSEPSLPAGRRGWTFWQYTSKGNGLLYGLGRSTAADLDVYNGTLNELKVEFGINDEEIPNMTPGTAKEKLGNIARRRSAPSRYGTVLGEYPAYSTVSFIEVVPVQISGTADKGGEQWLKLTDGSYVNYKLYNSNGILTEYFQILSQPVVPPPPADTYVLTVTVTDDKGYFGSADITMKMQ
jgi:GH25 family lysozyme M1 (1,4-beta-N-acetylmuramidase)